MDRSNHSGIICLTIIIIIIVDHRVCRPHVNKLDKNIKHGWVLGDENCTLPPPHWKVMIHNPKQKPLSLECEKIVITRLLSFDSYLKLTQ